MEASIASDDHSDEEFVESMTEGEKEETHEETDKGNIETRQEGDLLITFSTTLERFMERHDSQLEHLTREISQLQDRSSRFAPSQGEGEVIPGRLGEKVLPLERRGIHQSVGGDPNPDDLRSYEAVALSPRAVDICDHSMAAIPGTKEQQSLHGVVEPNLQTYHFRTGSPYRYTSGPWDHKPINLPPGVLKDQMTLQQCGTSLTLTGRAPTTARSLERDIEEGTLSGDKSARRQAVTSGTRSGVLKLGSGTEVEIQSSAVTNGTRLSEVKMVSDSEVGSTLSTKLSRVEKNRTRREPELVEFYEQDGSETVKMLNDGIIAEYYGARPKHILTSNTKDTNTRTDTRQLYDKSSNTIYEGFDYESYMRHEQNRMNRYSTEQLKNNNEDLEVTDMRPLHRFVLDPNAIAIGQDRLKAYTNSRMLVVDKSKGDLLSTREYDWGPRPRDAHPRSISTATPRAATFPHSSHEFTNTEDEDTQWTNENPSRIISSKIADATDVQAYLKRYAYMGLSSPDPRFANMTDPNDMFKMAVMKFQMMAGINETGFVCNETVKMMDMPRCGLPDEVGMSMVAKRRRRRRYTTLARGRRWTKTELTYRINNYSPDLPKHVIDTEIQNAFQRWSEVSPLNFAKVKDSSARVDIKISFGSRNHGDGFSFDGPRGTLAHAFAPQNGQVHFDEDESWKTDSDIDLRWVAIHEFGHSLGLGHSDVKDAIMYPFYMGYKSKPQLHSDDIAGIRYIYGSMMTTKRPIPTSRSTFTNPRSLPTSTTRMPPSGHAICRDPTVDAIFAVGEDVYVFKGSEYYMGHRGRFLSPARPISVDWPGLPANIDTAVYLDGSIVFFKGHQCWHYNSSRHPIGPNPQSISTVFPRLPSNISAAFVWSGNGKLYVIKDETYYRMSKRSWFSSNTYRVDSYYTQSLHTWKGLPSKIDAAFNYTNSRTYFFSGSNFYRFNDISFQVDSGYPESTAKYWLGCSDRSQSDAKAPAEDMMEMEWMKGGDQFMVGEADPSDCVGLPTYSVFLSTIAVLASCLVYP